MENYECGGLFYLLNDIKTQFFNFKIEQLKNVNTMWKKAFFKKFGH